MPIALRNVTTVIDYNAGTTAPNSIDLFDEMMHLLFSVKAVPAYNNNHPFGNGNGYIVTIDQKRIYIAGDTGSQRTAAELAELANIDIAFPVHEYSVHDDAATGGRFRAHDKTQSGLSLSLPRSERQPRQLDHVQKPDEHRFQHRSPAAQVVLVHAEEINHRDTEGTEKKTVRAMTDLSFASPSGKASSCRLRSPLPLGEAASYRAVRGSLPRDANSLTRSIPRDLSRRERCGPQSSPCFLCASVVNLVWLHWK